MTYYFERFNSLAVANCVYHLCVSSTDPGIQQVDVPLNLEALIWVIRSVVLLLKSRYAVFDPVLQVQSQLCSPLSAHHLSLFVFLSLHMDQLVSLHGQFVSLHPHLSKESENLLSVALLNEVFEFELELDE